MLALSCLPVASLIAGPLADHVFEPLLAPGGRLADSAGRILGVGAGRGIALLLILVGLLIEVAIVFALQYQPLRRLERNIPDAIPDDPQVLAVQDLGGGLSA
jgi:hypothetical protein